MSCGHASITPADTNNAIDMVDWTNILDDTPSAARPFVIPVDSQSNTLN